MGKQPAVAADETEVSASCTDTPGGKVLDRGAQRCVSRAEYIYPEFDKFKYRTANISAGKFWASC